MRRIILLPGLGADAELFYPQRECFGHQLSICAGPAAEQMRGQTPSLDRAAEWTAAMIADSLGQDDDFVLGGMSFGGSLAMQMVAMDLLRPRRLVLIASNRTSDTISSTFRWQRRIGSRLPPACIRAGLGLATRLFARREQLDRDQHERLRAMADRANIDQLLWGAAAIDRWRMSRTDESRIRVPIDQIHGRRDWVIPIETDHATEIIEDGRHLVTWTHAERINAFLRAAASATTD